MNRMDFEERSSRAREKRAGFKTRIGVCCGAACLSMGSEDVLAALKEDVESRSMNQETEVVRTGCMGPCTRGPLVRYMPEDVVYEKVPAKEAGLLNQSMLVDRSPIHEKEVFAEDRNGAGVGTGHPFFHRQMRIVLKDCGEIDPEDIDDCIAHGGYSTLSKTLSTSTPQGIIDEIVASGLRGRGGAGYPTGLKWQTVNNQLGAGKFVVCNGDEGDPGAFMDRSVLEGNPHRIVEGMAIAAYAVGADRGFAYIRGEYPLAVRRMEKAIRDARRIGLLGKDILGSGFDFDMEVRMGAGAFVCGEETALMASIEGRRATPRPRPPYPAESGLWGRPTLINNVETLAAVVPILQNGAAWYSAIGTAGSKGTKVFALAGKVRHSGVIEVPMGTTLREIVFEMGGGIPDGKRFKAAQTGGPSGGCIPEAHLDVEMDYESLRELGSIMGSGGLVVMDEDTDMVDIARFFMHFSMEESCGKCLPCRAGTRMMHDMIERIRDGEAKEGDLGMLEELAAYVKDASLCGLGTAAPNPLMSTLRHFREEYTARIREQG